MVPSAHAPVKTKWQTPTGVYRHSPAEANMLTALEQADIARFQVRDAGPCAAAGIDCRPEVYSNITCLRLCVRDGRSVCRRR